MMRFPAPKWIQVGGASILMVLIFLPRCCDGGKWPPLHKMAGAEGEKSTLLRDSQSSLDEHLWSLHDRRLAIVIPFTRMEVVGLKQAIASWMDLGPLCSRPLFGVPKEIKVDLVFWFHRDLATNNQSLVEELKRAVEVTLASAGPQCFTGIKFLSARLTV